MSLTERNHGFPARPDARGREAPGPSVEIRIAHPLTRRDAEGIARLFRQEGAIEHLGMIREDPSLGIDYTGPDVQQYFRRYSNLTPIVARDYAGVVRGTITIERLSRGANYARAQLWVSDSAFQREGPGLGLELLQKAEAYILGPAEYGALELEYLEAGVVVDINGDHLPRSLELLEKSGYERFGPKQPGRAKSWDSKKGAFVPRTLQLVTKRRVDYMAENRHRVVTDLMELGVYQPSPPQQPAA